jgi:hypothetical protein
VKVNNPFFRWHNLDVCGVQNQRVVRQYKGFPSPKRTQGVKFPEFADYAKRMQNRKAEKLVSR